jgi:hypothetical protein
MLGGSQTQYGFNVPVCFLVVDGLQRHEQAIKGSSFTIEVILSALNGYGVERNGHFRGLELGKEPG